MWRERNNRLFRQKEETKEQILEHVKEAVRHRLAKLKNVAKDPINMSLYSSWGCLSLFLNLLKYYCL